MGDNPVLLFWLAIFGLGLIGVAFKAWQWRRIRSGRAFPGRHEVAWRNVICSAITIGGVGIVYEVADYVRAHATFPAFMIFGAVSLALLFAIGALVDLRASSR